MNPDSATGKKPQRLKERLREVTSAAILAAAEKVLLEQGMDAPMEVIAARAGVAVGTLYNHFEDRQALVKELLESHRTQLRADVHAAEQRTQALPVREQLLAMVRAMVGSWSKIYLATRGEHVINATKRADLRHRIAKLFGGALERGRKEGLLAEDPEGLQPVLLQALLPAFFGLSADDPKHYPFDRAAERIVDAFLHGAGKRGRR
jgi:AcrR family transcriptional regulator